MTTETFDQQQDRLLKEAHELLIKIRDAMEHAIPDADFDCGVTGELTDLFWEIEKLVGKSEFIHDDDRPGSGKKKFPY